MARDDDRRRSRYDDDDDRRDRRGRDRDDDDRRRGRDDDDDRRGRGRDRDDDDRGSRRSRDRDDDDRGSSRRGGSGFNYKRPSREAARAAATQSGGNYDSIVKEGIKVFKPREGKNTIRILPCTWEGGEFYSMDIYCNYGIGVDQQTYLSLSKMLGKKDPLDEARKEAEKDGDEKLAKALTPKKRRGMWVIDRNAPEDGPQFWAAAWTFDKDLINVAVDEDSGAMTYIDDPDEGNDIRFYREGTGRNTKYPASKIKILAKSPLADDPRDQREWLDYIKDNPIPDILQYYDYDHIEAAFGGVARVNEDDDDDDRKGGRRGRGRGRDRDDDERGSGRGRRGRDDDDRGSRRRGRDDDDDDDRRDRRGRDDDDDRRGRSRDRDDDDRRDSRKRDDDDDDRRDRRRDRDDDDRGSRRGRDRDDDDDRKRDRDDDDDRGGRRGRDRDDDKDDDRKRERASVKDRLAEMRERSKDRDKEDDRKRDVGEKRGRDRDDDDDRGSRRRDRDDDDDRGSRRRDRD